MRLSDARILAVYPQDTTTRFLDRIVSYLQNHLGDDFYCYKIKSTEQSHHDCFKMINNARNKFIIFLGHGRSDSLFGASIPDDENLFANSSVALMGEPRSLNENIFIGIQNCGIFNGNVVFALSCQSNRRKDSIGYHSILGGAKSFIGFGDIPTDLEDDNGLSIRELSIFKGIFVRIVKICLLYCIKENCTTEKLVDLIKIKTNREIFSLFKTNTRSKGKIAKHLFYFKNDITIMGSHFVDLLQLK